MYITPHFVAASSAYLTFRLGPLGNLSPALLGQILARTIPEGAGHNCFTDSEVLTHLAAALVTVGEMTPGPGDPLYTPMSDLHNRMWGFKGQSFINVDLETADGRIRNAGCSFCNNRIEPQLRDGDRFVCCLQDGQTKFAEIVLRKDGMVELRVIPGTDGCTIKDCDTGLESCLPLLEVCPMSVIECVTAVTTRSLRRK